MKNWSLGLVCLTILGQIYLGVSLKFPPTIEQLQIINKISDVVDGPIALWGLRLLILIFSLVLTQMWAKRLNKLFNNNVGSIARILILISPLFFSWWYLYPTSGLKFFLIFSIFFVFFKNIKKGIIVCVFGILLFSLLESRERAPIFHKFSVTDVTRVVTERFSREDSLENRIISPLWLRRVGYNKVFMMYKQIVGEFMLFFDPETLFFQEVTPNEQKSMLIFYWPEVFLFFFGIFAITRKKHLKLSWMILGLGVLSFANYLFCSKQIYLRFGFTLLPISILMATGIGYLGEMIKKKIIVAKIFLGIVLVMVGNGVLANFNDLLVRPEFWLDNRPIVYSFLFENIRKLNVESIDRVVATSKLEGLDDYCHYYFKNCGSKFSKDGFDLSVELPKKNTVYAGFAGEFVGSDYGNNMKSGWRDLLGSKGLTLIAEREIRDSVAYHYGNTILVIVSK